MRRSDLVSVVVPVFNEERYLAELVRRCIAACETLPQNCEIVLVDDGSSDRSVALMEGAATSHPGQVFGVVLNRNYGQHAAVMAGLKEARGDIVVTLDADLQNPPEEIPRLVRKMQEGFDVVGSVRVKRDDSFLRRFPSMIVNKMVQKATGVLMHDYGCMLRAYRRPVVDAMLMCSERSTFVPILANSFARTTAEIDVEHVARASGSSRYGFWKLINLQFDLMTSMTTFPLRLLSVIGGVISVAGIGFGGLLMFLRVIHGAEWAAQGIFTLFAILFTFIGAQFIGLGLLGEYIGRIYTDVRARPRSFVDRVVGRPDSATYPSKDSTAAGTARAAIPSMGRTDGDFAPSSSTAAGFSTDSSETGNVH